MSVPVNDPFADPIIPPSTHPTIGSFRGRLIMITPTKTEMVQDNLNPGKIVERITANITVVDGQGPVPVVKGNPPTPTGQYLEGPDFTGVWLQSERVVTQLHDYVGTGRPVLGVIDTRNPGTDPKKGNPWGITAATPEQKQHAVNFLNSRTVGAAAAPAPVPAAQPQYTTAPAMQQYAQQANLYAQPTAPPVAAPAAQPVAAPVQAPAPGVASPAVPGPAPVANPFLQQAGQLAAQPQTANPFLNNRQ